MTVFDASVYVDALLSAGSPGNDARAALRDQAVLEVPAIFAAEATSAIRALLRRHEITLATATSALEQVRTVRTVQYPFEPFVVRVWELRDNLTVYDSWYVALAEWLGCDFVTADTRIIGAPGARCPVRHVAEP